MLDQRPKVPLRLCVTYPSELAAMQDLAVGSRTVANPIERTVHRVPADRVAPTQGSRADGKPLSGWCDSPWWDWINGQSRLSALVLGLIQRARITGSSEDITRDSYRCGMV